MITQYLQTKHAVLISVGTFSTGTQVTHQYSMAKYISWVITNYYKISLEKLSHILMIHFKTLMLFPGSEQ